MNPQEAAFIADIREHPDDDTPRLIFSDWLQENGQVKRAAFVRLQCELACLDRLGAAGSFHSDTDRKFELQLAEREFIIEYGIDVLAPYWIWASLYPTKFRRGFIEAVELPAEYWIEHGDAICAAIPLRECVLTTTPKVNCYTGRDGGGIYSLLCDSRHFDWASILTQSPLSILESLLALRWPGVKVKLPGRSSRQEAMHIVDFDALI